MLRPIPRRSQPRLPRYILLPLYHISLHFYSTSYLLFFLHKPHNIIADTGRNLVLHLQLQLNNQPQRLQQRPNLLPSSLLLELTPTKSGFRSSSPSSQRRARGTNSNTARPVSNERAAPVQTRPNASYRTNAITSSSTTTPSFCTPLPSLCTPTPPPSSSLRPPHPNLSIHPRHANAYPHDILQASKCIVTTLPLPLASQSLTSGELSSRQGRFKPPLLAASGNQGVVYLSASQSTRNGTVGGGGTGVKNNSPFVGSATTPPVTRNAPPAPPSSVSSSSDRRAHV